MFPTTVRSVAATTAIAAVFLGVAGIASATPRHIDGDQTFTQETRQAESTFIRGKEYFTSDDNDDS